MSVLLSTTQTDPSVPPRPREEEILDSIRTTFAERGFDGASMQELARAAGMSVGNFYRYFPSKAAMVEALIRRDLTEVDQKFSEVLQAPDPFLALRYGLHQRVAEESQGCGDGTLWAEINAAAARKPEIAAVVQGMERDISRYLTLVFARITGLSQDAAERRFGAHATMAVMLVKAVAMQGNRGENPQRADLIKLVQRIIDVILDEVAAAKAKE
ncbi:TetR family transcriptional regulator [Gemmobacter lanyuensis]|uniref:TetR family transcriptional regulator n=1 Tax=Gemmobacter lanyuensis TaxID=1054497 RepID=A0A918IQZ1_9RHOB|nr:TetR/AcrR family transcriptional regulator [Gemmobacter lanyuensis]GGW24755.1 TetR family transcriptional regulator [Gemmobacter lanyuensis]